MNPNLVKGKIVLCIGLDRAGPKDALSAFLAGAVGTVIADGLPKDFSLIFPLPTSRLTAGDGNRTAKLLHQLNKVSINTSSYFYLEMIVNNINDMLRICTAYIYSVLVLLHLNSNPTASILKSIEVNDTLAPYGPSFSSRDPNPITHNCGPVFFTYVPTQSVKLAFICEKLFLEKSESPLILFYFKGKIK